MREELARSLEINSAGFDDWGLNLDAAHGALERFSWLYRHYFRVETHGIENVPEGRVLLVANHAGQLPLDGMMIAMAMGLEAKPPRVVRSMIERWFPALPFVMSYFSRTGQVVGDPRNCWGLLEAEQCIVVFPEGIRGSGKPFSKRYELQRFGTGFLRLALETNSPVVPVSVVGSEETYPALFHLEGLARLLGLPYLPVTPMFPALGPLGLLPLPVKIQLFFGEPMRFDLPLDAPDVEVEAAIERVKAAISGGIERGLARRPELGFLAKLFGGKR